MPSLEKFSLALLAAKLGVTIQRHGFRDAVRTLLPLHLDYGMEDVERALKKFVPDGYFLQEEEDCVFLVAVEVEDHHPLSPEKILAYGELLGTFGGGLELCLYRCDRWGNGYFDDIWVQELMLIFDEARVSDTQSDTTKRRRKT